MPLLYDLLKHEYYAKQWTSLFYRSLLPPLVVTQLYVIVIVFDIISHSCHSIIKPLFLELSPGRINMARLAIINPGDLKSLSVQCFHYRRHLSNQQMLCPLQNPALLGSLQRYHPSNLQPLCWRQNQSYTRVIYDLWAPSRIRPCWGSTASWPELSPSKARSLMESLSSPGPVSAVAVL